MLFTTPTQEARIYVGGKRGFDGLPITQQELEAVIQDYQMTAPANERGAVRITPTTYLFQDYREEGWEIGLLNYPRFPLPSDRFITFALKLGWLLLQELQQNRVSMVLVDQTYLLEAAHAEQGPSHRVQAGSQPQATLNEAG